MEIVQDNQQCASVTRTATPVRTAAVILLLFAQKVISLIVTCHMGNYKMKVTDSALCTVTRASGVIFLISLLVGSPKYGHLPCDKTLKTWQRAQIQGIPSAVLILLEGRMC